MTNRGAVMPTKLVDDEPGIDPVDPMEAAAGPGPSAAATGTAAAELPARSGSAPVGTA